MQTMLKSHGISLKKKNQSHSRKKKTAPSTLKIVDSNQIKENNKP
jgi:hypothetical protein